MSKVFVPFLKCIFTRRQITTKLDTKMSQRTITSFFSSKKNELKSPEKETLSVTGNETDKRNISNDAESETFESIVRKKPRIVQQLSDSENEEVPKRSAQMEAQETEKVDNIKTKPLRTYSKKDKSKKRTSATTVLTDEVKSKILEDIKKDLSEKAIKSEVKEDISENKVPKITGDIVEKQAMPQADKKIDTASYDPSKTKYHPINDAIWKHGEKTPYIALARTFQKIEEESGRLKIIDALANYFRSVIVLSPDDLLPSIYLCLNKLGPVYEGLELGIAENYLMKVIAQTTGRNMKQVKSDAGKTGDLGIIAENSRTNQRTMFQPAALTVQSVFAKLKEIAQITGQASITRKLEKVQALFVSCKPCEARYVMRSLAGKLRIGLAEQSVLQALATACVLTPPCQDYPPSNLNTASNMSKEHLRKLIEEEALILKTTHSECPNYDKIIPAILEEGIKELPKHCRLTPGIPLKPMLAQPTKCIDEVFQQFEDKNFTCEWKYDGERAQIHVCDDGSVKIFSRNMEDNTSKYPDIISSLRNALKPNIKSCIIDTEAVAWDQERKCIMPFQVLSTRKRKDAVEGDIRVKVRVFMFDLLYINGEPLVQKSLNERRSLLRQHFDEVEEKFSHVTCLDSTSLEEIQEFLDESIRGNCEGLMVKSLEKDAEYKIAKRSKCWLKLKKDYLQGVGDTLDLVVIGGYLGRGKRTGNYGGFLLACYDPDSDEYQSICKIGTGFSDESLSTHAEFLKQHVIPTPKSYYRYDTSLEPDHWFDPVQVWEIKCADLSLSPVHRAAIGIVDAEKGISLRFPRYLGIRADKSVEDATTASQVADLYKNQDQIKNQAKTPRTNEEGFY